MGVRPDARNLMGPITLPRAEEAPRARAATNVAATVFMMPVVRRQWGVANVDVDIQVIPVKAVVMGMIEDDDCG